MVVHADIFLLKFKWVGRSFLCSSQPLAQTFPIKRTIFFGWLRLQHPFSSRLVIN